MQLALLETVPLCIEAVCQSRQIYRLTASRPSAPPSTDRPRRPHTSILLKVAGIVVGPIVIVAVLPSSSRPERLTFRSFAATAISHPPFTHSLSQSVSSSVSPSFSHSIRHSRFRTHSVSFLHLVRFSLGVLGVKATPSLDSDYGLHSGLKTG